MCHERGEDQRLAANARHPNLTAEFATDASMEHQLTIDL